jgi:hypothetical protein
MAYYLQAKIPGMGRSNANIWCFDPTIVMIRMTEVIPEIIWCIEDRAWKRYDWFTEYAAGEGAILVAERDAIRRGPIYSFRLRTGTSQTIQGHAERYAVTVRSEKRIPEPLRSRLLEFFHSLNSERALCEIDSFRLEKNTRYDA